MDKSFKISLAAARVNAEMTQEEAAKALGVARNTLRSYENKKTTPNWNVVNKMSEVYHISIDHLFFS